MQTFDLDSLFSLPLSPEAFEEMLQLQDFLGTFAYDIHADDS
jgi:hypothetical protein